MSLRRICVNVYMLCGLGVVLLVLITDLVSRLFFERSHLGIVFYPTSLSLGVLSVALGLLHLRVSRDFKSRQAIFAALFALGMFSFIWWLYVIVVENSFVGAAEISTRMLFSTALMVPALLDILYTVATRWDGGRIPGGAESNLPE